MDQFTQAYIEAALWSTTDDAGEPLDKNYGPDDLSPLAYATLANDCASFRHAFRDDLNESNMAQAGHDFWLTRNGHGAGFWDGDWPEPLATQLTKAAEACGECDLYIGDDGLIHCT